jgi:hypothetical protein
MKTPLFLQKEMLLVFIISLTTMMLARAQQEEVMNSHLTITMKFSALAFTMFTLLFKPSIQETSKSVDVRTPNH